MELFASIIGILIVLAPIGIWNRLIKIHGDIKAIKEQEQEKLELLERIADELKKPEEGVLEECAG